MSKFWKYIVVGVIAFAIGSAAVASAQVSFSRFAITNDDGSRTVKVGTGGKLAVFANGKVRVQNFPQVQQVSGSVDVSNLPQVQTVGVSGDVSVANFPSLQQVAGSVSVNNLPTVQTVQGGVTVTNLPVSQKVTGDITVANFPSVQQVAGKVDIGESGLPVPSTIVNLYARACVNRTAPDACVDTGGQNGFNYLVPAGKALLITDVIISRSNGRLWTDALGDIFPGQFVSRLERLQTPLNQS